MGDAIIMVADWARGASAVGKFCGVMASVTDDAKLNFNGKPDYA